MQHTIYVLRLGMLVGRLSHNDQQRISEMQTHMMALHFSNKLLNIKSHSDHSSSFLGQNNVLVILLPQEAATGIRMMLNVHHHVTDVTTLFCMSVDILNIVVISVA